MAAPAVIGGIGAGVNAVQGIASSQRSKKEGQQAAKQADQQQKYMNQILLGIDPQTGGQSSVGGLLGQIIGGMQGATGNLDAIAGSGAGRLNDLADQMVGGYSPVDAGSAYQFGDIGTGQSFQFSDVNTGQSYQFSPIQTGQSYNFQQGSNLMDQTMQAFQQEAAGVRNTALDQQARQSAADVSGLDALLASRGLGRGSGAATGALADLAGNQAAERAGLERELASMGQQAALQGAQFDVNRALQEQQMQSNYNLGERQFLADTALGQASLGANYNLGERGMLTDAQLAQQQMRSGYNLNERGMLTDAQLAQQQMRSNYDISNRGLLADTGFRNEQARQSALSGAGGLVDAGLSSQLQAALGAGNMYSGMLGPLLNMFMGGQQIAGQNIAQAGQGAANPFGNALTEFAGNWDKFFSGNSSTNKNLKKGF